MSSLAKDINSQIDSFTDKLKRRQISGSYQVALEACQLLMRVISAARWHQPEQLISQIRQLGKTFENAQPTEFTCGNIVRRVLAIIREEIDGTEIDSTAPMMSKIGSTAPMMSKMFSLLESDDRSYPGSESEISSTSRSSVPKSHDLRSIVIQGIRDLIDEIQSIGEGIEAMAADLIHDDEVLLTPTPNSQTVLNFLIKARQKRKFTVLVTECYPNHTETAHNFAKTLSKNKIETVVIPDSHVFAVMSRVGKIIVGAKSVFANGGTVSIAGVATVCEAAKAHKTHVFSVAGIYKLSPIYTFDNEDSIEVGNSGKVVGFSNNNLVQHSFISNPLFDYVPPEHIDIYLTNDGGFAPSSIYRIVLENYKTEDATLD